MTQQSEMVKLPSDCQAVLKWEIMVNMGKIVLGCEQQPMTPQTHGCALETGNFQTLITVLDIYPS